MNNDKILKNSNTFMNKYEKIKEYSTLLCHIYEILQNLLSNLLSINVDYYRDESVIHETVILILNCINYLFDICHIVKSQKSKTTEKSQSQKKKETEYHWQKINKTNKSLFTS